MDRVLLVEDNQRLAQELTTSLELAGFEVERAGTLAQAKACFAKAEFHALLLDVNLPDGTGFEWCKELRDAGHAHPILFITAKVDEESVIEGLSLGGTDYLRKPFSTRELVARIRAQTGRAGKAGKQVAYLGVGLDLAEKRASLDGKPLALSPREFQMITLLVRRGGNTVTREQALDEIDKEGEVFHRSLDTLVSRLRKKLKTASGGTLDVEAEYGAGYKLVRTEKK